MILVGGENLIDLVQEDSKEGLPLYRAIPGGSPYNVAMATARQGWDVYYLTPISMDSLGDLLAKHLLNSGVKLVAERNELPTSLAVVSINKGMPTYSFHRNATAERDVSLAMLESIEPSGGRIFHLGSLAITDGDDADAWEAYFHRCKSAGILTSLDPNIRPSLIPNRSAYIARLERMLQSTDVLKLSDEDLAWILPHKPMEVAWEELRDSSSAGLSILTMGKKGATASVDTCSVTVPIFGVDKLVDTVGSGDTFMATILTWLADQAFCDCQSLATLDESTLEIGMQRASKAAALNCRHQGCHPPTKEELTHQPDWDINVAHLQ